jgi:hypothetical protein
MTRAGSTDAGSFLELGDPETVYVLHVPRHTIGAGTAIPRAGCYPDGRWSQGQGLSGGLDPPEPGALQVDEPRGGAPERESVAKISEGALQRGTQRQQVVGSYRTTGSEHTFHGIGRLPETDTT